MSQFGSFHSLAPSQLSMRSQPDNHWKRTSGLPLMFKDNQAETSINLKQDVLKLFLQEDQDQNMQVDIGFFRYTANQSFVDARKLANGGNDTSFFCLIQNSVGSYDQNSRSNQYLGLIDVVYQYNDGAEKRFVYEFINKVGQFADLAKTNKMVLGFGHFDREGIFIGPKIDFGLTNYYVNIYIE